MIALKHLTGWAVQITRADGTKFFAAGSGGSVTPTWPLSQCKFANAWRDELRQHDFNARVTYAHPVEIPRS